MKARGLSLLSGGLDSILAVALLRKQGIHVDPVVYASPFFDTRPAKKAAAQLDIPLRTVDFTADIVELIEKPPHGFGGGMNPCIDCHARMIKRAGQLMQELGYDFVATGEVLNQRPMSQTKKSLALVEKDSGLQGRLLRPLSALLLEPTHPELEGKVDRPQLLNLSGRSRKPQIALAAELGIKEYPSPAGGCLLTEKGFCRKLADLQDHEGLADTKHINLLKIGRHLRLPGGTKCIAGRNRMDNQTLKNAVCSCDAVLWSVNVPGATIYVPGGITNPADLPLLCGISAGYSDYGVRDKVTVRITTPSGTCECETTPIPQEQIRTWML